VARAPKFKPLPPPTIEMLADRVMAGEREACARAVLEQGRKLRATFGGDARYDALIRELAKAVRNRVA
jgi:hypothetical protein